MFTVPTLTVALAPSFDSPVHVRTEVFHQTPALPRTACPDGAREPSSSVKRVWLLITAPLSPLFYLRLLCHSRLTTALGSTSELIAIANLLEIRGVADESVYPRAGLLWWTAIPLAAALGNLGAQRTL